MASNFFGNIFRVTTWGESHGKAIGAVIDGCPAGLAISQEDIQQELDKRAPGKSPFTSPRKEKDQVEILSGVFEGVTTGAPIHLIIQNTEVNSAPYVKDLLRPGHANYTYLEKYGIFDYRGGGRSSARETACRVAAGSIAKKILLAQGIEVLAYLKQVGMTTAEVLQEFSSLQTATWNSPIFCPDPVAALAMMEAIQQVKEEGDSIGGVVEFIATGVPVGLGDPVYGKLEASIASAMMSIPASKGIEMGEGFRVATLKGSTHNDLFIVKEGKSALASNHAGGTLGGISTGLPIVGRVAFKPTSSIKKAQQTATCDGKEAILALKENSFHDPCVAIRATCVVEAMLALCLVDALLASRSAKL